MPLGLYISVPFCRTKCTYCNFASDVFSRAVFDKYIARLCAEVKNSPATAEQIEASFDRAVDSIYFGGGTPTLLTVEQLERIFVTIRQNFDVQPGAEITLECAPGTLSEEMLGCFSHNCVSRVSLGAQSLIDQEARSVGRLHNRETFLNDITRLRGAGISNINVDLIAGLPHQTRDSWAQSLGELIATGVPHASVYMLEVDEDSRLGRELIAGGQKYHAHFVPDEDLTAEMYELACERLNAAGIEQYEISNFALPGFESKHNLKYWTRQPYFGFGVDAHSMLHSSQAVDRAASPGSNRKPGDRRRSNMDAAGDPSPAPNALRFSNSDNLQAYLSATPPDKTAVSWNSALQETCFLGLRLTKGLNLRSVAAEFGQDMSAILDPTIAECVDLGLMELEGDFVRLTPTGRLLSNEVFEKFIALGEPAIAKTGR